MPTQVPYANRIKELRSNLKLSQYDIAVLLKMNAADRVSRWENGRVMPTITNIIRLSEILNVKPDELYPALFEKLRKDVEHSGCI